MEAAPPVAAPAVPPQSAAPAPDAGAAPPPPPADAAPAPGGDAQQPDAGPVDPNQLVDQLLQGAGMITTAVGSTGAAVVQLAALLQDQGDIPQPVSDAIQRIGIISKLTDSPVIDPAQAGELPEELRADPVAGVQLLEAQLYDTIGKLSSAFDGAGQVLSGAQITQEVGQQLGSAAQVVDQARMAVWAAVKLVPPPAADDAGAPPAGDAAQPPAEPAPGQAPEG